MIDNAACTMCGAEVESVGPIFCECLAAKELWLALPVEQSAGFSKIVSLWKCLKKFIIRGHTYSVVQILSYAQKFAIKSDSAFGFCWRVITRRDSELGWGFYAENWIDRMELWGSEWDYALRSHCADRRTYALLVVQFLKRFPPHSHCANDLRQLGKISITLLGRNVTSTRSHIKELLKNQKKMDPFVRSCLDDCFDLYSDAIPTTKQALQDYKAKHYDDANIDVSSVMDATTTCEDGFKEKEGVVSPLTKRNNDAFMLSAISLSIINMIRLNGDSI
ncbi:hypothetical protein Goshw_006716 [Gossypium schwendimanii]|uniref:Pectinesterase inhibitor domain-containing protein n=1 Tax=Gossypium schwendimanii TaxID=34291 RepID=A0A7J9N6N3_GOSSC|nr:hypothetical protein [Gossypium schwendimanii]